MNLADFIVRDSGKREEFTGGMVRDTAAGKLRPDLVRDGPMLLRWIKLMTAGAVKYAARNWMKGTGQAEYDRALESADRHFNTWITWRKDGVNIEDPDNPTTEPLKEDHCAAVYFNLNQVEYLADKTGTQKLSAELLSKEPGKDSGTVEGLPSTP